MLVMNELEHTPQTKEATDALNYFKEVFTLFPNCPFIIHCVDAVEEFDNIISYHIKLWIQDGRNPKHKIEVRQTELSKPITIKQILEAMASNEHYNSDEFKWHSHRFLTSFEKHSSEQNLFIAHFEEHTFNKKKA